MNNQEREAANHAVNRIRNHEVCIRILEKQKEFGFSWIRRVPKSGVLWWWEWGKVRPIIRLTDRQVDLLIQEYRDEIMRQQFLVDSL